MRVATLSNIGTTGWRFDTAPVGAALAARRAGMDEAA